MSDEKNRDPSSSRRAVERRDRDSTRFRRLVEEIRDYAIILLDSNGIVSSWNAGAELTTGYRPDEIIGRHVSVFQAQDEWRSERANRLLADAVEKGSAQEEGWRVRKDGSRFWADVVVTAIRDESGALQGFAKITRDLTTRRRAEKTISELSGRILRVQEDERKRVAGQLMDGIGSQLTSLEGKLRALSRTAATADESSRHLIDESLALTGSVSRFTRSLASSLYPSILERGGLTSSLRWYAQNFSKRVGIPVEIETRLGSSNLSYDIQLALFRVAQECLANIEAHANAKRAAIRLQRTTVGVTFTVRDDGNGMPGNLFTAGSNRTSSLANAATRGLGIVDMVRRVQDFGGTLEIHSSDQGTIVTAVIPVTDGSAH